jgi:hypothetical protein
LQALLQKEGFAVSQAGQYSVLFWLWEILPDHWPFMENLTPLFVAVERLVMKIARRFSAHCFIVAQPIHVERGE